MARHYAATLKLVLLVAAVPSTAIAGATFDTNEVFGSAIVRELPLIIGAGPKTPRGVCRPIFGSILFTPKALRVYVFKGENDDPGFSVQADTTVQSREINIGTTECLIDLVVTRREATKDSSTNMLPEAGSGVPGAENKSVLDDKEMYITAAYFPSSKSDCGNLNTSFRFNSSGLIMMTNLASGFSITSRISDDHFYRSLTFTHDTCITNIDVHFYTKYEGKMRQEEQK